MQKQTIALVDDDRNILTSLSIALEKEGFKVQTYIDGESALIGLTRTPPDLAIVDIKMPKMDGEELLKKLRKKTSLPVIFLTSKDDEIDELLGLKLGADDFIKKSGGFSIKVLIERIRVQLRKKDSKEIIEENKSIISHGKLKLDPSQLECEWNGKQLPDKLTTTEFLLVKELAKRPGIRERFPGRCLQDLQLAVEEPGKGCFRPDHKLRHGCLPARQDLQPFKMRGPEGPVPFFMLRHSRLHQTSHLERG